jgi:hypothetical protein
MNACCLCFTRFVVLATLLHTAGCSRDGTLPSVAAAAPGQSLQASPIPAAYAFPAILPLDTAFRLNVVLPLPAELDAGSLRLLLRGEDGGEQLMRDAQGQEIRATVNAAAGTAQFGALLQSSRAGLVYVRVQGRLKNGRETYRSPPVAVEFSAEAPVAPVSALVGDKSITFYDPDGRLVSERTIVHGAAEVLRDAAGNELRRIVFEQAIASDDLTRVYVAVTSHIAPANADSKRQDEPEPGPSEIILLSAGHVQWTHPLPEGAKLLIPERPLARSGGRSLVAYSAEAGHYVTLLDAKGTVIYTRILKHVEPLSLQLSATGRYIGWQGVRSRLDGGKEHLFQVLDSMSDQTWEFVYSADGESVWLVDVPGKGFAVYVDGKLAAECDFCQ